MCNMLDVVLKGLSILRWLVLIAIFPVFIWPNVMSVQSIVEHGGWEGVNPPGVWKLAKINSRILWWKITGNFSQISALPYMGLNWVSLNEPTGVVKGGGCSIGIKNEKNEDFDLAISLGICAHVESEEISPNYAKLNPDQLNLAHSMAYAVPLGGRGPRDYVIWSYALLSNVAINGLENTGRLYEQACAKAFKGASTSRAECLAYMYAIDEQVDFTPRNEKERRAVAFKAGIHAWMWSLSDARLAADFWSGLNNGARQGSASKELVASGRTWINSFSNRGNESKNIMILQKTWSRDSLYDLNLALKKAQLRLISEEVWSGI